MSPRLYDLFTPMHSRHNWRSIVWCRCRIDERQVLWCFFTLFLNFEPWLDCRNCGVRALHAKWHFTCLILRDATGGIVLLMKFWLRNMIVQHNRCRQTAEKSFWTNPKSTPVNTVSRWSIVISTPNTDYYGLKNLNTYKHGLFLYCS